MNCDGCVDGLDLALMLVNWGKTDPRYDLDGNGTVGASDLGWLFIGWKACP